VEAAVKAQSQSLKAYEDAVAQAKENLDAVLKAGQTLTKGLQDLGKSVIGLAQEAIAEGVNTSKQLAASKNLHEAVDLQTAHAKNQLDRLVQEGSRLTDATVKLFEEAYAPVQARVSATIDKLVKHRQ
jgi:phasin family protein